MYFIKLWDSCLKYVDHDYIQCNAHEPRLEMCLGHQSGARSIYHLQFKFKFHWRFSANVSLLTLVVFIKESLLSPATWLSALAVYLTDNYRIDKK